MEPRKRRRRARPEIDRTVPSPCVAICTIDDEGLCVGCQRNMDEIREWIILSRDEKLAVLDLVAERRENAGV